MDHQDGGPESDSRIETNTKEDIYMEMMLVISGMLVMTVTSLLLPRVHTARVRGRQS